tara:strand:- start:7516 stop:8316 length:801 start_codon:yes stop_codon:yes gene_type:complete
LYFNKKYCEEDLEKWYNGFQSDTNDDNAIRIAYLTKDDLSPELYEELVDQSPNYRNVQVITENPLLDEEEVAVFRWDFRAIVNKNTRLCRVYLLNQVAGSIDAIARITGALLYVERNAFLIHGSSIVHDGKGYLFTGVSGSGKSTIAELSGATVLNDEISLIQVSQDGEAYVHGTPFYGDLKQGENKHAPLHGMYLLSQSDDVFIEEVEEMKQHLSLLRNIIFFQTDLNSFDQINSIVEKTLQCTPLKMLHFEKNNRFMEALPSYG